MSPITVFVRTLFKTSAIFIGFTTIMLHPSLEWTSSSPTRVAAGQSPQENAVDGLVGALKDSDAGVRRRSVKSVTRARSAD
jgi:hypothetical protein